MSDRKTNFCVNLPLKLFRVTVTNDDRGSLKSFYIHYLVSTWTTCWRNLNQIVWFEMYKILISSKKSEFFKTIFDKTLTPFCIFSAWNNCLMVTLKDCLKIKFSDYLSVVVWFVLIPMTVIGIINTKTFNFASLIYNLCEGVCGCWDVCA